MTYKEKLAPVFVCRREADGPLWLQGEEELPQATVKRSEQLSTINEALNDTEINTKSFIPNVDVGGFDAWISAIAAKNKALAHLSAQQLAQTLTAADLLGDAALVQEVAAAQRLRILAVGVPLTAPNQGATATGPGPGGPSATVACNGAATGNSEDGSSPPESPDRAGPVYFCSDVNGPLRWLEQLAADLPETVLWTLLQETIGFPKHVGDGTIDDWLLALPPPLMVLAARACSPCIDIRGAFHAQIRDDRKARGIAALVGQLHSHLQEVFMRLPPPKQAERGVACGVARDGCSRVLGSVCAAPALRMLHLQLHPSGQDRKSIATLMRHLRAATGLESLTIKGNTFSKKKPVVEVRESAHDADKAAASTLFVRMRRELTQTLAALPRLQTLKLEDVRSIEYALSHALRESATALAALTCLHIVACGFNVDTMAIRKVTKVALPALTEILVSSAPGSPVDPEGYEKFAAKVRSKGQQKVPLPEPTQVRHTARVDPSAQRQALLPPDGAPAVAEEDEAAADEDAPPGRSAPRSGYGSGWRSSDFDVAVSKITPGFAGVLQEACSKDGLRSFSLDGAAWGVDTSVVGCMHGLRFPTIDCAAAVLSPQTGLTYLFLGGDVQPPEDLDGDALAALLAALPALRTLGLRACGMNEAAAALHPEIGWEWDDLSDMTRNWFETWVPSTEKLVLARAGHAVPLEQLSLDLLHPLGKWAALVGGEPVREYTADVCCVLRAAGRLTALTSLDFSVNPGAVAPDLLADALAETLASLRRLRRLRLALGWDESVQPAPFLRSVRQLSHLTELQMRLQGELQEPLREEDFVQLVLGLDGADPSHFTEEGAMEAGSAVAEGAGATGCQGNGGDESDVRSNGDLSAEGGEDRQGLASLRILRIGPLDSTFRIMERRIERAGWECGGESRLRGAVCVAAQHADWLESVGELQQVVGNARGKLFVVLG